MFISIQFVRPLCDSLPLYPAKCPVSVLSSAFRSSVYVIISREKFCGGIHHFHEHPHQHGTVSENVRRWNELSEQQIDLGGHEQCDLHRNHMIRKRHMRRYPISPSVCMNIALLPKLGPASQTNFIIGVLALGRHLV